MLKYFGYGERKHIIFILIEKYIIKWKFTRKTVPALKALSLENRDPSPKPSLR